MIAAERKENSLFSVYDLFCVKFLTRLRLQLCHLNEHNIRHCFGDTVSPTYECNTEIEALALVFLFHSKILTLQ